MFNDNNYTMSTYWCPNDVISRQPLAILQTNEIKLLMSSSITSITNDLFWILERIDMYSVIWERYLTTLLRSGIDYSDGLVIIYPIFGSDI